VPQDNEHAEEQRPRKLARQATKRATGDKTADQEGAPATRRIKWTGVDEDSSPLLQLPAELRNDIYEYIAVDACAELHPRTRGKLASRSTLCRVSKQVRDEYHAVLYMTTPYIKAHVKDFDFGHIVTFLNKLSDRELNALPTLSIPTQRKLHIHTHITEACPGNPEGLQKWLLRCQHPTKKGTRIDVDYTVEGRKSINRFWFAGVPYSAQGAPCHVWRTLTEKLKQLETTTEEGRDSRLYQELKKVVDAVERGCSV